MATQRPLRLGIMGFGQIGRQLYDLATYREGIEIVAIADIGKPEILHYLLRSEVEAPERHRLEGNFLVNESFRARLMSTDQPAEMPWDIFEVDMVIDATGKYRSAEAMQSHLEGGAQRVLLRTLPEDRIDRIVIPGVNGASIHQDDRMISGGSPTTSALCLLLHILSQKFVIECGSMTSIHSYTSDQALQDYAAADFRRSRSGATNIIPNGHEGGQWIGSVLPAFAGKIQTSALNVPVQDGSLLDVNLVMEDPAVDAAAINEAMREGAQALPGVVGIADDPIVSSDVLGSSLSLLFDSKGTLHAGEHIIKTLSWYETLGHAARLLDIAELYGAIDLKKEAA